MEKLNRQITEGQRSLSDIKSISDQNALLSRRKRILDQLVAGERHWSRYLETIQRDLPDGVQLTQVSIADNQLKIEGRAKDYPQVSNFSINLGDSKMLRDTSIDFAGKPEKTGPDSKNSSAENLIDFAISSSVEQGTH